MRSLRTRVFVTVALVLAAATAVPALLSRRRTLVEERQILGPRQMPTLAGVEQAVQRAYTEGGWERARAAMQPPPAERHARVLPVNPANHVPAATAPELEAATIRAAQADGRLSIEVERDGRRSKSKLP